jgi:hypothetical protein
MDIDFISHKVPIGGDKQNEFLLMLETKSEEYRVLTVFISLDLRGNYGMLLSGLYKVVNEPYKSSEVYLETYVWRGNLFIVQIEYNETLIMNIFNIESRLLIPTMKLKEVIEKWKDEYLREMGFLKFENSKALSHIYSILLLAYYMRGTYAKETYYDMYNDSIKCAIEKCADRYGLTKSTLYSQCTRGLGIKGIHDFYVLSNEYLINREGGIMNTLEKIFNMDNMKEDFLTLFE